MNKVQWAINVKEPLDAGRRDDELCTRLCVIKITLPVKSETSSTFGTGTNLADVLSWVEGAVTPMEI